MTVNVAAVLAGLPSFDGVNASHPAGTSGGIVVVSVAVSAGEDGTANNEVGSLTLYLPLGSSASDINDAILDAVVAWANGLPHGWNIRSRDILFQPFRKE